MNNKSIMLISFILIFLILAFFASGDSPWTQPGFWTRTGDQITTIYEVLINNMTVINLNVTNHDVNGSITSTDWSNVTLNESQIQDLNHTVDTNCTADNSCPLITYESDSIDCSRLDGNVSDLCTLVDTFEPSLWNETSDNYIEPINATTAEVDTINTTKIYGQSGNVEIWL